VIKGMLIDSFAPNPDALATHRIAIKASPDVVYRALWTTDLGNPVIKLLLGLRMLPGFISRGGGSLPRNQNITLQTLIDSQFGLLAEEPNHEVLFGVTGRFWRPTGNLSPFDRASFNSPVPPGIARAVWSFTVEPTENGHTILTTETRVTCGDRTSRRKFRAYWFFVRPFSGLIRRLMLRAVRHTSVCRGPTKEFP
jgi:hypothetical protein